MKERRLYLALLFSVTIAQFSCSSTQQEYPAIITFKRNGGWCWFQDERAVIHNGTLVFGTVAHSSGFMGDSLAGNIEVTAYDIGTRKPLGTSVLHPKLEEDDHAAPAFLLLEDERLLAVYSKHGGDKLIRYRITKSPLDYLSWGPEETITRDANATYSNLFRLSGENGGRGRIYDFYRGEGWNPNFVISDDDAKTWRYGGRLIKFDGRPYVKYTSNGRDEIHFITTEHHPRDFDNSIYHGYIKNGQVFRSDGSLIRDLSEGPIMPMEATRVFAGDSMNVAWTVDIHLDSAGNPYIAYVVQKDKDPEQLQYRYARWTGKDWDDTFLAYGGTALYEREKDYSGLVALNPRNPDIVYISADVDPGTGRDLISKKDNQRHYEIFKGTSQNHAKDWSWQAITKDSELDNLRPIVPMTDGQHQVLLWLKGTYLAYTNFNLDVIGIIDP